MADEVTKSIYARELNDNPLLAEALDYYENEVTELWKQEKNEAARQELWRQLQAHQMFKQYILSTIAGGKIAAQAIAHKTWLQKVRRAI